MANTPTNDGGGFKQDINRMGQSVDTLKHDVGDLADSAADAARQGASELRNTARHALDAAKEKFEGAKETAADAARSLTGVIKRHPVASVAVVAGAGLLIGMLLRHKKA